MILVAITYFDMHVFGDFKTKIRFFGQNYRQHYDKPTFNAFHNLQIGRNFSYYYSFESEKMNVLIVGLFILDWPVPPWEEGNGTATVTPPVTGGVTYTAVYHP